MVTFYGEYKRKIIGDELIITERITKTNETNRAKNEWIVRRTAKAFLLECGHITHVEGRVPKNFTTCYDCAISEDENKELLE